MDLVTGSCFTKRLMFSIIVVLGAGFASIGLRASDQAGSLKQQEEFILLTVDKETLRAELQTLPPVGQPVQRLHSFRIAIGKAVGDKLKEGDNKTPEGVYLSKKHIGSDQLLASKYGDSAITLNFPNPVDRFEGKTGYGIWLHGAGNDDRIASAKVTEGCVAFYNADIGRLTSWLKPEQGLVVIAQNLKDVNAAADLKAVQAKTEAWLAAWQQRDIDSYISYYDDKFSFAGKSKEAYKKYKQRVFASYKAISLKTEGLRIVTHPKYAVALMNQDFQGDKRFSSVGRKILYWKKSAEGWGIVQEHFDRQTFQKHTFTLADLEKLRTGSLTEVSSRQGAASSPL